VSGTDLKEMYKVFNMGHRMEVYLEEKFAQKVIAISKSFGVDAKVVGRVEAADTKKVTLKTAQGTFVY
jgi:phosphoribosylformylglycinamidine cyclo-ligase